MFLVTTLLAIPLVGYVLLMRAMERRFDAFFTGDNGPVERREEWPEPLARLASSAEASNIKLQDLQVYCVANGFTIEYVWRLRSTPGLFDLISQEYGLEDYVPTESGRFRPQDHLPDWWTPQEHAKTHYYAGNPGGVGDQFVVFHDELNQALFVHYYHNW